MRENKGITLIALVVTIIVLIILAGVSINLVLGENGVIRQAKKAKTKTIHTSVYEELKLAELDYVTSKSTSDTEETLIEYLISKSIIGENIAGGTEEVYPINVTALLGSKQALGNGNVEDGPDVYVLIKEEGIAGIANSEVGINSIPDNSSLNLEDYPKLKLPIVTKTVYSVEYYGYEESENEQLGELIDTNEEVKFGIYDVGEENVVLITPSTPDKLIHRRFSTPWVYDYIVYNVNENDKNYGKPITDKVYYVFDDDDYEFYYNETGDLVCRRPAK